MSEFTEMEGLRDGNVRRHFVTFYSPGTFFAETTTWPVSSYSVEEATDLAKDVVERYGARPYAFQFTTKERTALDLDSKVVDTSGFYFFKGEIRTLEEVRNANNPEETALLANMECNGYERAITTTNGWRWTQPLKEGDTVLDVELLPLVKER